MRNKFGRLGKREGTVQLRRTVTIKVPSGELEQTPGNQNSQLGHTLIQYTTGAKENKSTLPIRKEMQLYNSMNTT